MLKKSSRNVWARGAVICSTIAILLSYEFLFTSHPSKWVSSVIHIVVLALGYTLGRQFPAGEYSEIQTLDLPAQSSTSPSIFR